MKEDPGNKEPRMKFFSFEIIIEKEGDDEGYFAYSPSLPGCFSNGKTIEETRKNIREALQQHVLSLRERSLPIPQKERIVHVEALSIGVA
jgi:predicted RNase H-like HicB family nuclease